ncbi:MAG: 30S ribosomal protein S20 [Candidatus Shapirobacteria bacterium]|nr:30S ribosomal protein S20 [Candidatus Shapirobacteria bacterium]
MPTTKSAKKTLKQQQRRGKENQRLRTAYKKAVRYFNENVSLEALSAAYTKIDQAAKNHIIHENKASRLKSQLAKNLKETQKKN